MEIKISTVNERLKEPNDRYTLDLFLKVRVSRKEAEHLLNSYLLDKSVRATIIIDE